MREAGEGGTTEEPAGGVHVEHLEKRLGVTMTDGERIVWAVQWCQSWESGIQPSNCARLAAKAIDALRGAALPDDESAAVMLREIRGELG